MSQCYTGKYLTIYIYVHTHISARHIPHACISVLSGFQLPMVTRSTSDRLKHVHPAFCGVYWIKTVNC